MTGMPPKLSGSETIVSSRFAFVSSLVVKRTFRSPNDLVDMPCPQPVDRCRTVGVQIGRDQPLPRLLRGREVTGNPIQPFNRSGVLKLARRIDELMGVFAEGNDRPAISPQIERRFGDTQLLRDAV